MLQIISSLTSLILAEKKIQNGRFIALFCSIMAAIVECALVYGVISLI